MKITPSALFQRVLEFLARQLGWRGVDYFEFAAEAGVDAGVVFYGGAEVEDALFGHFGGLLGWVEVEVMGKRCQRAIKMIKQIKGIELRLRCILLSRSAV